MRALAIIFFLAATIAMADAAPADEAADAATCKRFGVPAQIEACNTLMRDLAAQLRKTPDDPALYIARADLHERVRQIPLAIADLDRAITLKPSDAFYVLRSSLKGMVRDIDGAMDDANQALRLNPKNADAQVNLGYAYLSKRETNRAIDAFTRAIALDPKQAKIYTARAGAYGTKGDKASAEADCQRALALMPKRDGDMGYDGKGHTVRCHPEWAASP